MKTEELKEQMSKLGHKLGQTAAQAGYKLKLDVKLYQSAFLFHAVTAFKVFDRAHNLIPFAYDNGETLTEDGYLTRHLGRKYPHAINQVKRYRQHPDQLSLNLDIDPKIVKHFAERLFLIEDVRYSEVNLDTTGDTLQQLAMDIIMFADLLNRDLTDLDNY